jgi:hypothetical protein
MNKSSEKEGEKGERQDRGTGTCSVDRDFYGNISGDEQILGMDASHKI